MNSILKNFLIFDIREYIIKKYSEFHHKELILDLTDIYKKEFPERRHSHIRFRNKHKKYPWLAKSTLNGRIYHPRISIKEMHYNNGDIYLCYFMLCRKYYICNIHSKQWKQIDISKKGYNRIVHIDDKFTIYKSDSVANNLIAEYNHDPNKNRKIIFGTNLFLLNVWVDELYLYARLFGYSTSCLKIHVYNYNKFLQEHDEVLLPANDTYLKKIIELNNIHVHENVNVSTSKQYLYIITNRIIIYSKPELNEIYSYYLPELYYNFRISNGFLFAYKRYKKNMYVHNAITGEKLYVIKTNYVIQGIDSCNDVLFCQGLKNLHVYFLQQKKLIY